MITKKTNIEDRYIPGLKPKYSDKDFTLESNIWHTQRNIKRLKIKRELAATSWERKQIDMNIKTQRGFLTIDLHELERKRKTGTSHQIKKKSVIETAAFRPDGIETPETPITAY